MLRLLPYVPILGRRCFLNLSPRRSIHISSSKLVEDDSKQSYVHVALQHKEAAVAYDIKLNDDCLEMRVDDVRMDFNYIWLRDHCRCDACLNSKNMQRLIDPIDIDPNISPHEVSISDGKKNLLITWPDGHTTSYQIDWLGRSYTRSNQRQEDKTRIFWDRQTLEASLPPDVAFEEYMESEEGVTRLLRCLHTFGIAFMSGVPKTRAMTRVIGERVHSPLKSSIFGEIDNAPELAKKLNDHSHGNGYLPFHMDYPSHYDPPG
ncbi:trimethyllysine dioxygenase, mitochondrial-like [Amphiura filiformis]|uniref:trimethyllysine dioxygenase, mitochondrial-like n=1 Tax=Amphiura filiformis TaxID=82378 RepID=UPI003B20CF8C